MPLLLGLDLGTSYFKVGLFEADGAMRGLGRVRVDKRAPAPGWSELPVEEFWALLRKALGEALATAGAEAAEIAGVSYSSQANTFVLLDAQERPLTPLIFWTDTRGDPLAENAAAFGQTEEFRRRIGWAGVNAQMAVAKWRWMKTHHPATWGRVVRAMTISDYLTCALTGERVGDSSTAALLGLYDLGTKRWWPEALAAFEVEEKVLSQPLAPGTGGLVTRSAAQELVGLRAGLPFAVGALDHYMAALGSGIEVVADVSISTGTVLAALTMVDRVEPLPGCYCGPGTGDRFYRLAFDPDGAGPLEAYQQQHCPEVPLATLLAAQDDSGVILGANLRPHASALRGMAEAIANRHAELVRTVVREKVRRVVATGGGARSPLLLQITANALRVPVVTTDCLERACLGAAASAAVAAGWYARIETALAAMVHEARVFAPTDA